MAVVVTPAPGGHEPRQPAEQLADDGLAVAWPLLGFALAAALFLLLPSQLQGDVGTVHGFTWQEAVDLLTPIAVIPPLWLAFERAALMATRWRTAFLVLAAVLIGAQGLHLGTNAIGDLFDPGAPRQAFYATPPGQLDVWFDEVLSHWLWHLSWTALLVLLVAVVAARPADRIPLDAVVAWPVRRRPSPSAAIGGVAGAIHGLVWAVVTIEGSTTDQGIPAAAALLLLGIAIRRRGVRGRVVAVFLVVSGVVALGFVAVYVAIYGWPPPELTETILKG